MQNEPISLPDWRTDWLYSLIFKEVEDHWAMCAKSTDEYNRYVLVEEWSSDKDAQCNGAVMRAWIRDEHGMNEITLPAYVEERKKGLRGWYKTYPFVLFEFHIQPDRQHIVMGYTIGTMGGEGGSYAVIGEKENAVPEPKGGGWIS